MKLVYGILGILASLGGLFAWIYKLIKDNQALKETVASKDAQAKFKEWSDQIQGIESKISEEERNYEELKKAALSGSGDKPDNDSKN